MLEMLFQTNFPFCPYIHFVALTICCPFLALPQSWGKRDSHPSKVCWNCWIQNEKLVLNDLWAAYFTGNQSSRQLFNPGTLGLERGGGAALKVGLFWLKNVQHAFSTLNTFNVIYLYYKT